MADRFDFLPAHRAVPGQLLRNAPQPILSALLSGKPQQCPLSGYPETQICAQDPVANMRWQAERRFCLFGISLAQRRLRNSLINRYLNTTGKKPARITHSL